MLENLSAKLDRIFKKLRGHGRLSESNIKDALREVRLALLEADVHFKVVKEFISHVQERAVGKEVLDSLTPAQQVIKIVYEELTMLMGGEGNVPIKLSNYPASIMLVGLQGSGKTTTAAKIAKYIKEQKGRSPYLVPADIYRPAAIDQLIKLGKQIDVPVFVPKPEMDPATIVIKAKNEVPSLGIDTVIIDTAGRLHIDDEMMNELVKLKELVKPSEVLLVADAMTGQDALNVANAFNKRLGFDGVVLTKLDGDARGGAALSIKHVTGKPIKFIGIGEKLDGLELFHPDRLASRILGMGDVLTLVEKAQAAFDEKKALEIERKIRKYEFTLEDFRDQLSQIKKMGSLESILSMIPGAGKLKGIKVDERELVKIEAIINSMTPKERRYPQIINGSRRLRIAKGSGTKVEDVNRLLKQYQQTKKMLKLFQKKGKRGLAKGLFPF